VGESWTAGVVGDPDAATDAATDAAAESADVGAGGAEGRVGEGDEEPRLVARSGVNATSAAGVAGAAGSAAATTWRVTSVPLSGKVAARSVRSLVTSALSTVTRSGVPSTAGR
jgi:hypothetical protein